MPKARFIWGIPFCVILAILFAWLGASVPIHFRAIAPAVLVEAGRGSESMVGRAELYLDSGKTGPAALLLHPADKAGADTAGQWERHDAIVSEHPRFRISGGPAPFFDQFLELVERDGEELDQTSVIALLLPRGNRERLLGYLRYSASTVVRSIIETRSVTALTIFMPVASAAGHPLDASILLTALLAQSDHLQPEFARELRGVIEDAVEGDRVALDRMELSYLAVLTLGKRLNWTQLTALVEMVQSLEVLSDFAAYVREYPDAAEVLYAAALMGRDLAGILEYLRAGGERAQEDIEYVVSLGGGAISELLQRDLPVYDAPATMSWLDGPLAIARDAWFAGIAHRQVLLASAMKMGALFLAGFFIARALQLTFDAVARGRRTLRRFRAIIGGVLIAIFLGLVIEPSLLRFSNDPSPEDLGETFRFAIALSVDTIQTNIANPLMIDQATLLILAFFLVLQLVVYISGLIKILEIKRQDVTADLKMTLLENEEHLFDLGLYVGLSGTVASLILLAMGVVQASLIAAYASTFFGIIFTAILKIIHLRPYRKRLILERSHHQDLGRMQGDVRV